MTNTTKTEVVTRTVKIIPRQYRQERDEYESTLAMTAQLTEGKHADAIGYLSAWAAHDQSLAYCEIDVHYDGELVACYYRDAEAAKAAAQGKKGHMGFMLVGVWHHDEKRYSFHS